jgi:hypothetical protein
MIRKHNQIVDFVERASEVLHTMLEAETPADLYGALDQLQAMVKINKDAFRAELETSEAGPVAMGRRWIVHMVRSKRTAKAYRAIAAECGVQLALLGHREAFEAILEKNTSTTNTLRLNVEANTIE